MIQFLYLTNVFLSKKSMDRFTLRNVVKDGQGGVFLDLRIHPKASRTKINGLYGEDTLKISLAAPPVDGKANAELIRYLSKCLSVSRADITITFGKKGRKKKVFISGLTSKAVIELLSEGN